MEILPYSRLLKPLFSEHVLILRRKQKRDQLFTKWNHALITNYPIFQTNVAKYAFGKLSSACCCLLFGFCVHQHRLIERGVCDGAGPLAVVSPYIESCGCHSV
jgi:hypothetical protein